MYKLQPVIPDYRLRMKHYVRRDQRHMDKRFAKFFDNEVDTRDGFLIGGQSYVVVGEAADTDCEIAIACLSRASYHAVRVELADLVIAATGGYDDDDAFHAHIEAAQSCFVFGVFDTDLVVTLSPEMRLIIAQFITRLVDDKVPIILPVPEVYGDTIDLGMYGVRFADFLADRFKVYKYDE